MKQLFLAFAATAALASASFASQITIDGQKNQYKAQTTAQVTHTEYTQEEQQTTCTRQVPIGSHQECHQAGGGQNCYEVGGGQECHEVGGGQECHEVGGGQECHMEGGGQECGLTPTGQQCHDVPGHQVCSGEPSHQECGLVPGHQECYDLPGHQECTTEPTHQECSTVTDYKNETYSCTQTVQVPHVVVDSEIENDVVVNVQINPNLPKGLNEVVELAQSPTALTLKSVKSTAKVLMYSTQTQKVISDNGRIKKVQTTVSVKLVDRNLALGAFLTPLSELTADINGIYITTGLIADPATVKFDLEVRRNRTFGKDETLFKRTVLSNEIGFANSAKQTKATFDFRKLGLDGKVGGQKLYIFLTVSPNVSVDNVVNSQDIPAGLGGQKSLSIKL